MFRKLLIFAVTSGLASKLYRRYRGDRIGRRMGAAAQTSNRRWNEPDPLRHR